MNNKVLKNTLKILMDSGKMIEIIVTNGYHMKGTILGFDDFIVVLEEINVKDNKIIFLNNIITIIPDKDVQLLSEEINQTDFEYFGRDLKILYKMEETSEEESDTEDLTDYLSELEDNEESTEDKEEHSSESGEDSGVNLKEMLHNWKEAVKLDDIEEFTIDTETDVPPPPPSNAPQPLPYVQPRVDLNQLDSTPSSMKEKRSYADMGFYLKY